MQRGCCDACWPLAALRCELEILVGRRLRHYVSRCKVIAAISGDVQPLVVQPSNQTQSTAKARVIPPHLIKHVLNHLRGDIDLVIIRGGGEATQLANKLTRELRNIIEAVKTSPLLKRPHQARDRRLVPAPPARLVPFSPKSRRDLRQAYALAV